MNRFVVFGRASLSVPAIAVAVGLAAHAGLPYLPLVGPPPLRIQAAGSLGVASARTVEDKPHPTAARNSAGVTAAQTAADDSEGTNLFGADLPPSSAGPTEPAAAADQPVTNALTTQVFELPTPNLVGISPETLATYFHRLPDGTNSVVPAAPYPISFLPPLPPDKSSKAEYIVK